MEEGVIAVGVGVLLLVLCTSWWDTTVRLGRIERKLNLLLRHSGVDLLQGLALSERVKQLASDPARKIEAIKVYRDETGAGLAEAKEAVEAFINSKYGRGLILHSRFSVLHSSFLIKCGTIPRIFWRCHVMNPG